MGKHLISNRISLKDFKGVAGVGIGGTGDNTASEARDTLRIVGRADHNTMNGVAGLDEYGMLKDEQIPEDLFSSGHALNGPKQIVAGSTTNVYRVTYWSDFRDIQVTIDNNDAAIYLDGNGQVVIDAPSTPGIMMLTITGSYNDEIYCNKSFPIDVVANTDHVNTPSIVSPVAGAFNLGPDITITGSTFSVSGGSDTHEGTDWQLATDAGFTSIVASVTNSASDKTSWTVTGLPPATQYYVRTRYKGVSMGYSNWSATNSFTTKASYQPTTEEAVLTASDRASNSRFSWSVAITTSGDRVIMGAYQANSSKGKAYVFVRSGTTWTQEAILADGIAGANWYYYGISVAINSTGNRVIIGAMNYYDVGGSFSAGRAYIYSRTGTSWTQEAIIGASDPGPGDQFGTSVSMDDTGTRVVVGAPNADPSGVANAGKTYVFTRSGTTWTQEAIITASDGVASDAFGTSVSIDSTGSRVVISSPHGTGSIGATPVPNSGKAYIYLRSGTTWSFENALRSDEPVSGQLFGWSVSISGDGIRAIVSEPVWRYATESITPGRVHIFRKVADYNWQVEARVMANDRANGDRFGESISISNDGTKIVVGSAYDDTNIGSLYLFTRSGITWSQQAKIVASNRAGGEYFGISVSISKDGTRIISGSIGSRPAGLSESGAAYIYS